MSTRRLHQYRHHLLHCHATVRAAVCSRAWEHHINNVAHQTAGYSLARHSPAASCATPAAARAASLAFGTHAPSTPHVTSTCSPTRGPHNVPGCAPRWNARTGRGHQAPYNPLAMHAAHTPRTLHGTASSLGPVFSSARAPPPPCSAAASAAAARQRAGPAREADTWRARGRRRGCGTYKYEHANCRSRWQVACIKAPAPAPAPTPTYTCSTRVPYARC